MTPIVRSMVRASRPRVTPGSPTAAASRRSAVNAAGLCYGARLAPICATAVRRRERTSRKRLRPSSVRSRRMYRRSTSSSLRLMNSARTSRSLIRVALEGRTPSPAAIAHSMSECAVTRESALPASSTASTSSIRGFGAPAEFAFTLRGHGDPSGPIRSRSSQR